MVRTAILGLLESVREQERELNEYRTETDVESFKKYVREELDGKANLEDVKQTLSQVVETVDEKASREEVEACLAGFARVEDMEKGLEGRVGRGELEKVIAGRVRVEDFREEVGRLGERVERVVREVEGLAGGMASRLEVGEVRERLERVSGELAEVREGIRGKVGAEEWREEMGRRVTVEEVEEMMDGKIGVEEMEKIVEALERKAEGERLEELEEMVRRKAEAKDVELIGAALNRKADRKSCEETRDEAALVRREVEGLVEELEQNFKSYAGFFEKLKGEIDACNKEVSKRAAKSEVSDLKTQLSRKMDGAVLAEELGRMREEVSKAGKSTSGEIDKVEYF